MLISAPRLLPVLIGTLGLLASVSGSVVRADDGEADHHASGATTETVDTRRDDDFDAILKKVQAGEILPLSKIKKTVEARWPGEIVRVTVDTEKAGTIYEFRILSSNGHMIEVEVDAANGQVVEVENE